MGMTGKRFFIVCEIFPPKSSRNGNPWILHSFIQNFDLYLDPRNRYMCTNSASMTFKLKNPMITHMIQ
jgi:hypothetical protein